MPAYIVEAPAESGQTLMNGNDVLVVFAADAAGAKAVAKALYDGDSDSMWDGATVTAIAAAADLEGWTLRLRLYDVGAREPAVDVSVVGAASDTFDLVAADAVTALNALPSIANAAYNSTTNVLTVAGSADGLGDHTLVAEWIPPWGVSAFTPFLGTIVDGGVAAADVTLALPADATAVPDMLKGARRG
jgi:hypothetical protein